MLENSSYEKDFYKWTQVQASLLKKNKFDKLDIENVIEEIEALGRSDKTKLYNLLVVLLQHLLKNNYALENKGNSTSWDSTILNSKIGIQRLLKSSPSLKTILKNIIDDAYEQARELALIETDILKEDLFPETCPWSLKEIFSDLEKKYCNEDLYNE
jgi:hypothetical protein